MSKAWNCNWLCLEEYDGECLVNKTWTGNCDCEHCECFMSCNSCKNYSCEDCPNG